MPENVFTTFYNENKTASREFYREYCTEAKELNIKPLTFKQWMKEQFNSWRYREQN